MSRLSAQGRLRCGQAGAANLARWKESQPEALDLKQAVADWEAALRHDVGKSPTAAQLGIMVAAVLSFTGIEVAQRKLLTSSRSTRQLNELLSAIPPLTGSLQRAIRMLGLAAGDPSESGDPDGVEDLGELVRRSVGRGKEVAIDGSEDDAERSAPSSE